MSDEPHASVFTRSSSPSTAQAGGDELRAGDNPAGCHDDGSSSVSEVTGGFGVDGAVDHSSIAPRPVDVEVDATGAPQASPSS